MKRQLSFLFVLILIVIVGTSGVKSVESSGTPPTGYTGTTAGQYCNSCHSGFALNTTGGSVDTVGLPAAYANGTAYTFSIKITHSAANRKRWGFSIKAINASGAAVGTFSTTNTNTGVVSGELTHKNAVVLATATNTYTYANLKWTAPATNTLTDKKIRFYLVAVAADGTGGSNSDYVYTKLITIPPSTKINSFTPTKATNGISVTIKGISFTGATAVSFGGVAASSFTVNNDSTITAVVGSGESGNVSVTSPAGTASLSGFIYCAAATTENFSLSGCNSLVYNGKTYTNSTVVTDTLKTLAGCDSVYRTANISIKKITASTQSINQSACDMFTYKNVTYNTSAVIKDTLKTIEGCDSVYLTINATVNPSVNGRVYHPTKGNIQNVKVSLTGTTTNNYTANGNYSVSCINAGSNAIIKPSKNNDINKANGVTSVDVLLVQRHILNTSKLTGVYKIIAADVDGNKSINSVDVLRMKRLILGTDTTFNSTTKGNRLWEFIDSSYQFTDTANPFPFKDSLTHNNLSLTQNNQSFIGIKLGDVNYDWNPASARHAFVKPVQLNYYSTIQGENIHTPVSVTDFTDLIALQYTLHFDNTKYDFVTLENNYLNVEYNASQAKVNGNISFIWIDKKGEEKTIKDSSQIFELILKPKTFLNNPEININDDVTPIEAWDKNFVQKTVLLTSKQKNEVPNNNIINSEIILYPNPTNSFVNVQVNKIISNGIIELVDLCGKKITKQPIRQGISLIDISKLAKGIYFVNVISNNETITKN